MSERKKKVILHTDFSQVKSGLGGFAKELLTYLYKLNKYDLVHYCCGIQWSHPELKRTPWKSVGCLPDNPQEIEALNRDPNLGRSAAYGSHYLDRIIQEEKPDIYIVSNDFWGQEFAVDKHWFSQINSVVHCTIDSLPIYKPAVDKVSKIKNYWMWSNFAEKEFHRLGYKHVKTVHGCVNTSNFFKLPDSKKRELRIKHNIPENAFIIGFIARNQLRKSYNELIEGYKIWKTQHPEIKNTYLLFCCSLSEGWDIPRLVSEHDVNHKEILMTYVCKACKGYQIKTYDDRKSPFQIDANGILTIGPNNKPVEIPIQTQDKDCPFCKTQKSQITSNVGLGVSDEELNEIYNLMDVYCHPMTSGGQERPIQEAKLAELITLVTNYSCGEEMCEEAAASFSLDFACYREFGTQFIKSATYPSSIAKQIHKVYSMDQNKKREMGKQARKWILDNFSIEIVGKKFEEFIDSCEFIDYSKVNLSADLKNPDAIIPEIEDDRPWLKYLYKHILNMDVTDQDQGLIYWEEQLRGL